MDTWQQSLSASALLGIAAAAIAAILVLVIVFRVHALLTLVTVSALTALAAGLPLTEIVGVMKSGFGSTLASVAIVVGFGAMIGRLVETSGGAASLANTLIRAFGEKKAPLALGIASLIVGFPIFFDAGLIVMLSIVFAVARRLKAPLLTLGIPVAGAFSVMHVFLPPHPGPIAAAEFYGVDVGWVLLVGLIVVFPVWYISGYRLGLIVGPKYPLPVPDILAGGPIDEDQPKNPASVATVIAIIVIPLVLIFFNTGLHMLASSGHVDLDAGWVQFARFIGDTPIALLITTLIAGVVLGSRRGMDKTALEKTLDGAIGPVASVILLTGAGGMFGAVLRASGIGDALADLMGDLGIPVIVACFIVAVALRVAQGSATVALTTAAGLMASAVMAGGYSSVQLAAIVLATAAGSVAASHVNDSGFWLVGRLMGMDPATTLKTWTVNQTLVAVIGFVFALLIFWAGGVIA